MGIKRRDIKEVENYINSLKDCKYIKTIYGRGSHLKIVWEYKGIRKKSSLSASPKRGFDQCFKPFKHYIRLDINKLEENIK